jgi:hypothetical protein
MKLGRIVSKPDRRDLMLRSILKDFLPAPPPSRSWDRELGFYNQAIPLFGNDRFGCCAFAAQGHHVLTWASNHGFFEPVTEADVLEAYARATGFVASEPQTDNGTEMRAALKDWRALGIGGHKIGAFARINPTDHETIKTAINLFGGVYVGAALPKDVVGAGRWVLQRGANSKAGSLGGHCFSVAAYDRHGLTLKTWGRMITTTWDWWDFYVDEVWTMIGPDWSADKKPTPAGLDGDLLFNYLARI